MSKILAYKISKDGKRLKVFREGWGCWSPLFVFLTVLGLFGLGLLCK